MAQCRNTVQKEQVYFAVMQLLNHPTADEVYEKVKSGFPTISRATVYRILNQMSDNGDLVRINIPGGANRYDGKTQPHCHARCVKCGRVFDVWKGVDAAVDLSGVELDGFRIIGCNIIFDALCDECE